MISVERKKEEYFIILFPENKEDNKNSKLS